MSEFPSLEAALGPPPKSLPFPGIIVCANCDDRPCWCCETCGAVFGICEHTEPPAPTPIDPAVLDAVQVLAAHGVNGIRYEALQAEAKARQ